MNGKSNRERKCPARANSTVAIAETTTFNSSAVGRISTIEIPATTMTAIYPEPPACPTMAYSNATANKESARTNVMSILYLWQRHTDLTLILTATVFVGGLANLIALEEQHLRHAFVGVDLGG